MTNKTVARNLQVVEAHLEAAAEGDKDAYQTFFNGMLKKWGVDSPEDIPEDKKDDFFEAVDKGWESDKEESALITTVADLQEVAGDSDSRDKYKGSVKKVLESQGKKNIGEVDDKKAFFAEVKKDYKAEAAGDKDGDEYKAYFNQKLKAGFPGFLFPHNASHDAATYNVFLL